MANVPLGPPPNSLNAQDKMGMFTPSWRQWFTDIFKKVAPNANRQDITAACAINPDSKYVSVGTFAASSGTYAVTLDAPTIPGLHMLIEMTARNGAKNVTLSLTNCTGGTSATTCTWNGTNQQLLLESADSKWVIYKQNGVTLS